MAYLLPSTLLLLLLDPAFMLGDHAAMNLADRRHHALKFGKTTSDFIMFQPDMSPLQQALTICSWLRTLRTDTPVHGWLSYATSDDDHAILIADKGYYNFFKEQNIDLQDKITPSIGEWYHHCTSWSASSQTRSVYFNGELVGSGSTSAGPLGMNGNLYLGNERHYDGSGPINDRQFGGELSKLNFFAKELTGEEIKTMSDAGLCSDIEEGYGGCRYLRWEDFLLEDRRGNVTEVDTECPARECAPSGEKNSTAAQNSTETSECDCPEPQIRNITRWDILYSDVFYNKTLTMELLQQLRSYWDMLGHFVGATISDGLVKHFKEHHTGQKCSA